MHIRSKISLGFAIVLTLLVIEGVLTVVFVNQTQRDVVDSVKREFYSGLEYNRIEVRAQEIRRYEKEYFIYILDPDTRRRYYDSWLFAVDALRENIDEIIDNDEGVWSAAEAEEARRWMEALQVYSDGFQKIAAGVDNGRALTTREANAGIVEAKDRFARILDGARSAGDEKYELAEGSLDTISEDFLLLNMVVLAIMSVAIFIGILFMVILPRTITQPLEELTAAARRMSLGDLSQRIVVDRAAGEFHELAGTLERMRVSQRLLMGRREADGA